VERPAFLEIYLDVNKLFYRPVGIEGDGKSEGAALLTS
jgi:hypothetical protein